MNLKIISRFLSGRFLSGRFKIIFRSLSDLFYPPTCTICGVRTEDKPVCAECEKHMELNLKPHCPECGTTIDKDCPIHKEPLFKNYFPVYIFGDNIRELIHGLKYSNRIDIGEYLGRQLFEKLTPSGIFDGIDGLVPMPLHKVKQRSRGYNQSEILAMPISKSTGISIIKKGVKRVRHTESQTKLDHEERKKNVADAFKPMASIKDKNVIIIDDVITTGATVNELARAIVSGGGKVRCAICAAHPETAQSKEYSI